MVFLFLKTLLLKKAVESPILLKVAQHFFNEMNIVIKFQVRIPLKNTSFDFNEKNQKAKNISGFIQVRTESPLLKLKLFRVKIYIEYYLIQFKFKAKKLKLFKKNESNEFTINSFYFLILSL